MALSSRINPFIRWNKHGLEDADVSFDEGAETG
jgi:hypothetical protein